jgi:adenine phosphoribosyltransferase
MLNGDRHAGMPSTEKPEPSPQDVLKAFITDVPDYPIEGVIFRDITPLLQHSAMFKYAIDLMTKPHHFQEIDLVVALEARGFLLAVPIALELNAGFAPIRKAGKLPRQTHKALAELEYGLAELEIHQDAIRKGQKVLLVDDVLATGGSAKAAIDLIEQLGAQVVEAQFLIELSFLKGRDKLSVPINSVIVY